MHDHASYPWWLFTANECSQSGASHAQACFSRRMRCLAPAAGVLPCVCPSRYHLCAHDLLEGASPVIVCVCVFKGVAWEEKAKLLLNCVCTGCCAVLALHVHVWCVAASVRCCESDVKWLDLRVAAHTVLGLHTLCYVASCTCSVWHDYVWEMALVRMHFN